MLPISQLKVSQQVLDRLISEGYNKQFMFCANMANANDYLLERAKHGLETKQIIPPIEAAFVLLNTYIIMLDKEMHPEDYQELTSQETNPH